METSVEGNLLLPVLPLRDVCLFPEASLTIVLARPPVLRTLEMAARIGGRVLALSQKDGATTPRDLQLMGTIATIAEDLVLSDGSHRVELDGVRRGRALDLIGADSLVAEVSCLAEGDPGDEWGPAVEALARYFKAHADLRGFLEEQRRSNDPMAWVNLACQHLPITASARQRLLESDAPSRCARISRGLDALLRKEQGN
jgi:ATP-dependent Lon protease